MSGHSFLFFLKAIVIYDAKITYFLLHLIADAKIHLNVTESWPSVDFRIEKCNGIARQVSLDTFLLSIFPIEKKSTGVRSSDRAGQAMGPLRPIQRFGNVLHI